MKAPAILETAQALVAGDKGLLAMDESTPTCNKRFAALGIAQTEEARRAYETGLSLCRPMYYDWPDDDEPDENDDEPEVAEVAEA